MARCLQLCLDTSDSQGNCFDPVAELCNRCAQAPALRTAAFPVPAGPRGCGSNCVETLQSSLGPADVFPATFEPTVPPVWWHWFPLLSTGCCSHLGALGLEISCGSRVGVGLRWTHARIWSRFLSVSDDESTSCIRCAGFQTADLLGRQQRAFVLHIAGF